MILEDWKKRSTIVANLLNPAFCGEIIRRVVISYTKKDKKPFPFALTYLILPLLLHKATRDEMPRSIATNLHNWINEKEYLFINFSDRVYELLPYTKESILFLLIHDSISILESGEISANNSTIKKYAVENGDEVNSIFKKAELLGKWFASSGNVQTIYMFLKIRP